MNEFRYYDLAIGQEQSFCYEVTEEKMKLFLELTGDNNPLHVEESFAGRYGFGRRVVYGMLTASLLSTLTGVYLPVKYCLIQRVDAKFAALVHIGDKLTVKGVVAELNESVRQAVIKAEIRNQANSKCVRAVVNVGFLE